MSRGLALIGVMAGLTLTSGTVTAQSSQGTSGDVVRVLTPETTVRVNADPNSLTVAKVPAGTVLDVKGREGAWYSVWLPGEQRLRRLGYIAGSDVELLRTKPPVRTTESADREPRPASPYASNKRPVGAGRTVKAGLDEVRLYAAQLPSAQRIVMQLFSATDSDLKEGEKKDETKTMQADGPRMLADRFVAKLKELGPFGEVTSSGDGVIPADALVVDGKFVELDPGSRAKRYFVGMGSGKSAVAVEGSIKTADGTVLATFRQRRLGVMGIAGGDSLGKLTGDTRSIGEDIAKFVSELAKGKVK